MSGNLPGSSPNPAMHCLVLPVLMSHSRRVRSSEAVAMEVGSCAQEVMSTTGPLWPEKIWGGWWDIMSGRGGGK